MKRLLGGAGAAIGVKILTGFAVAAAAATFAIAAGAVAITGSVNPLNWGRQVTTQGADCKAGGALMDVHGIGPCVASFARQHGAAVSESPAKDDQPEKPKTNAGNISNTNGNASAGGGNGNGGDKGNGQGSGGGHSARPGTPPGHAPIPAGARRYCPGQ